jgi:hypothetical protein
VEVEELLLGFSLPAHLIFEAEEKMMAVVIYSSEMTKHGRKIDVLEKHLL